ncbi:hypothetical protein HYT74_00935 [Candidatus Daviesbacteria bacterium]|nr:hypothetical protein [Candidatus Daviesbacteria bacterium]
MTNSSREQERAQHFTQLDTRIKQRVEQLIATSNIHHGRSRDSALYTSTTEPLKRWKNRPVIPSIQSVFPFITRSRLGDHIGIDLNITRDNHGEIDWWAIGIAPTSYLSLNVLELPYSRDWELSLRLSNEKSPSLLVSDRTRRKPIGIPALGRLMVWDRLFGTAFTADVILGYERVYPATVETLEVYDEILNKAKLY